jgi:hypothetical protein
MAPPTVKPVSPPSVAPPDPDDCTILFIEVANPWPPNQANRLGAGTWQLELLLCADNAPARAYFVTISTTASVPKQPTKRYGTLDDDHGPQEVSAADLITRVELQKQTG